VKKKDVYEELYVELLVKPTFVNISGIVYNEMNENCNYIFLAIQSKNNNWFNPSRQNF
jgi:hypothetical protein